MNPDQEERNDPRRLPMVTLEGKGYFVDSRLRQLRNVRNPHDFMDFTDVEWIYLETLLDLLNLKENTE